MVSKLTLNVLMLMFWYFYNFRKLYEKSRSILSIFVVNEALTSKMFCNQLPCKLEQFFATAAIIDIVSDRGAMKLFKLHVTWVPINV